MANRRGAAKRTALGSTALASVDAAAAVGGGRRRWRRLSRGRRRLAHGRRLESRLLLRLLGLLRRLLLFARRRDAGRQDVRLGIVRLAGDDRLAVLRGVGRRLAGLIGAGGVDDRRGALPGPGRGADGYGRAVAG